MNDDLKGGAASRGGGVQHFWLPAGAPAMPRIARAEGVYLWDTTGRRFLDCTSGPVAVNLGHGNARVIEAMHEQTRKVTFAYPSYFESEANVLVGDLLAAHAGPGFDRTFLVSSGAEAVEKCIEFARIDAVARGEETRFKVISRHPAFHGSTLACHALSSDPEESPLGPMVQRWPKVPVPWRYRPAAGLDQETDATRCAEALREAILAAGPETVLAFILEPIMGLVGGANYGPPGYYRRIREICNEFGVLLIHDEVMSGIGRCGRFLAAHYWPEARPDLVVIGKGLASGYCPLAGFMAPEAMVKTVVDAGGFHLGHTYKANPLACATGLAVLRETLRLDLVRRSEEAGARLRAWLTELQDELPVIGDVRGLGLFNAIELVQDREKKTMFPRERDVTAEISRMALDEDLLIYARRTFNGRFGDWLMMTPPLIATDDELAELVERLRRTLRRFRI